MDTYGKLHRNGIAIDAKDIETLCRRYQIKEFAFFGSSLRQDYSEASDIDVLVSFGENSDISLFDIIEIGLSLESMLKRRVDIVEKESLKNPIRRKSILESREIVYAA